MLEFIKHMSPQTHAAKNVLAALYGYNLKGDWLNGVPTLDRAYWYSCETVKTTLANPKYKYHNPIKVIREADQVKIVIEAATDHTKQTLLCSFKNKA